MSNNTNTDSSRQGNDDGRAWLEIRKQAALQIDPQTAEVMWTHGQILDPYGCYDLSPEEYCVGRVYFARSPDSDVWVCFYDLPKATLDELWRVIKSRQHENASQLCARGWRWSV